MPFTIGDALARLLAGWGLVLSEVVAAAEAIRTQFPDLAAQIDMFESWLRDKLAPVLDVEKFKATIRGIATDIMTGLTGVNPNAWRGSV